MRRILVCLIACAGLVAGCSDDDPEADDPAGPTETTAGDEGAGSDDRDETDGDDEPDGDEPSGDAAGFCELMTSEADVDPMTPEGQELMAEVLESAPDEIRADVETIFSIIDRLEGLDEDDPEVFGEVFALMFDPEIMAASASIEAYGIDECGLEPGWFDEASAQEEATTGDDDDEGDDDDDDDDRRSLSDEIGDWVEDNQPGAEWLDPIVSWTRINDSIQLAGELDADLGLEACAAVIAWADDTGQGDVSVTILDLEGTTLAESTDSGLCEAV